MNCPRCGQSDVEEPACPRCGVIFARLKPVAARPPRSQATPPPEDDQPRSSPLRAVLLPAALLVVLASVGFLTLRSPRVPAPTSVIPPADARAARAAPAGISLPPLPAAAAPSPPAPAELKVDGAGVSDADRAAAEALAAKIQGGVIPNALDLQAGEDLLTRHENDKGLRSLLQAALLSVASEERQQRRYDRAAALLRRASQISPESSRPWAALMDVLLEAEDWTGAEAAARSAIGLAPRSAEAFRGLGYALLRQDRNREAVEALRASVEIYPDASTQALLDRIVKGLADENGMTEQQLAHFHVRYDGGAHQDVGREILRALDRHYSTLTSTLDHQPSVPIPVILFSQDAYYDASGAPRWSGGVYNHLDGRIRIPIGGLTSTLTPDIDNVLIHELTHAFLADRSKGICPRDVHEGLAQYMEGKRLASELSPAEITALVDGRLDGVHGLYYGALSFVEYLMAQRGQGGMNDLIKAMGTTGNEDAAFRQVYGQDHASIRRAWSARLRQEHGS
jgi:tetratricopeptide (TPR) repeat protein